MDKRTDWVDYAKAIGIVLVVYGHVARGLYSAGLSLPVPLYKLADSIVYSFHMPLFFFLSGLFFHCSLLKKGPIKLMFSKVDTIFYPYLMWSIFQGSIEALLSNYTNGNASFSEVFSLLWAPRAQFWFLYALFFVFLTCTVAYFFTPRRLSPLVFLIAIPLYLYQDFLPYSKITYLISQNLVFFTFGIIFINHIKVGYLSKSHTLLSLFFLFTLGQWIFHGYLNMTYVDAGVTSLLLALTSILFIVSSSLLLARKKYTLIAFIGASSMAIYVMHILAGSATRIILNKLGVDSFYLHLTLGCLVGVLAPVAALLIINRFKIPYLFSAPVSAWLATVFTNAYQRTRQ